MDPAKVDGRDQNEIVEMKQKCLMKETRAVVTVRRGPGLRAGAQGEGRSAALTSADGRATGSPPKERGRPLPPGERVLTLSDLQIPERWFSG